MSLKQILYSFVFLLALFSGCSSSTEQHKATRRGIDSTFAVDIGGIRQYLSIRGKQQEAPLLLYLHGGPGESVMQQRETLTSSLEEYFVVVHWDQRGAGKTDSLNQMQSNPGLARMQQDAEEVVQQLRSRFGKKKIYLLGHSWGSLLGFHIAYHLPEQLYAFIAISPMVNQQKSQAIALDTLKTHFQEENNPKAIRQLATVAVPYQNLEQRVIQYRWQSVYDGEQVSDEQVAQVMPYLRNWEGKWGSLQRQIDSLNLQEKYPAYDCPIYFMVGKDDMQTNYLLAEQYFQWLKAPKKELFWFKTGHNLPALAPERMQEIIIREILPATHKR